MIRRWIAHAFGFIPHHQNRSSRSLRGLYPPMGALYSALPTTPRTTSLPRRCAGRKHRSGRSIDVHEGLRPCDVPSEQANGRCSEERGSEGGAPAHPGPHNIEPAHVGEHLHREVPVRHAPAHLEVRERRIGVYLHALDHCVCLECIRISCSTRRPLVPTSEGRNGTTRFRVSWNRAPPRVTVRTHSLSTVDTTTKT